MTSITIFCEHSDLLIGYGSDDVIRNVPYIDIDTKYSFDNSNDFPLAVAFVDGSYILCFKYDNCLRACSFFNDSFIECENVYDYLFSRQFGM